MKLHIKDMAAVGKPPKRSKAATLEMLQREVGVIKITALDRERLILVAVVAGITGLLLFYHVSLPSGAAIILVAGAIYATSVVFGRHGSLVARYLPRPPLQS